MMEIDINKIEQAIINQAVDEIVNEREIIRSVKEEVQKRINNRFVEVMDGYIEDIIKNSVDNALDFHYQKVNNWGAPDGQPTTIRKELEKAVDGFWTEKVNPKSGKSDKDGYSAITRAEYVMVRMIGESVEKHLKGDLTNITGALKDGIRNEVGKILDGMLGELFKIKSLQDQGKVDKWY